MERDAESGTRRAADFCTVFRTVFFAVLSAVFFAVFRALFRCGGGLFPRLDGVGELPAGGVRSAPFPDFDFDPICESMVSAIEEFAYRYGWI
jgi:hypothetical protein